MYRGPGSRRVAPDGGQASTPSPRRRRRTIYKFLRTNERQQHATAMHTGGGIFFCKFYGVAATHATAASGSITGASSSTTGSSTTTSRFWPPRMNDSTIV